jgi:hypothetical protein
MRGNRSDNAQVWCVNDQPWGSASDNGKRLAGRRPARGALLDWLRPLASGEGPDAKCAGDPAPLAAA